MAISSDFSCSISFELISLHHSWPAELWETDVCGPWLLLGKPGLCHFSAEWFCHICSLSDLWGVTGQLWISEGLTESPLIFTGEKKCLQLHYLSSFSKKTTSSIPMFANRDSELVLEHMYFIPKLNPVVWASLVWPPFINNVFFPVSINCRFPPLCELLKGLLSTEKGRHLCWQTLRPAVFRTCYRHSFMVPMYITNVQEGPFLMSSFNWVSKLERG